VYKETVAREYCHTDATAQDVIQKHHISTKTLIEWSKKHKV
jgi:transposase-like protein